MDSFNPKEYLQNYSYYGRGNSEHEYQNFVHGSPAPNQSFTGKWFTNVLSTGRPSFRTDMHFRLPVENVHISPVQINSTEQIQQPYRDYNDGTNTNQRICGMVARNAGSTENQPFGEPSSFGLSTNGSYTIVGNGGDLEDMLVHNSFQNSMIDSSHPHNPHQIHDYHQFITNPTCSIARPPSPAVRPTIPVSYLESFFPNDSDQKIRDRKRQRLDTPSTPATSSSFQALERPLPPKCRHRAGSPGLTRHTKDPVKNPKGAGRPRGATNLKTINGAKNQRWYRSLQRLRDHGDKKPFLQRDPRVDGDQREWETVRRAYKREVRAKEEQKKKKEQEAREDAELLPRDSHPEQLSADSPNKSGYGSGPEVRRYGQPAANRRELLTSNNCAPSISSLTDDEFQQIANYLESVP